MTRGEVAKKRKMSVWMVHSLERTALAKIRRNPEAQRLFKAWLLAGAPSAPVTRSDQDASKLLDYHLDMASWWKKYDELASRKGCEAEAKACLKEISKFHQAITIILATEIKP